MKSAVKLICALALTLLWAVTPALADVPTEMSVQGRLTNGAGAPVPAGLKNFTFKIYDQQVGGIEIWPAGPGELQTLTTDANGLWNAGVGTLIPLTEAVFQSPVRWLEVTVNDGVNPIETLPRIELRTNPYTYRAATSQHADSLGSSTYTDLVDQFVDEAGDTMSGLLQIDYANAGSSVPSLRASNVNAPYVPYAVGPYTFGQIGEAASDGPETKFGSLGVARGAAGMKIAVIGESHGTGAMNIGLYGWTSGIATNNYSGYFWGGDFVVGGTVTAGTGSVELPPNAIDNSEILDVPGIAFSSSFPFMALSASNTAQDVLTVTITTPSTGYIVVQGTATTRFSATTLANYSWFQIDETAGGSFSTRYLWSGGGAHASTANEYETASISKVYNYGPGTYTFRLEGNGWSSNNVSASTVVWQAELKATFYPRSYGTVSALVADRSEFDDATLVKVNDPQGQHSSEVYAVDLRELELRAARTKAEAERAQRELVEAKLSSASGVPRSTATSVEVPKR